MISTGHNINVALFYPLNTVMCFIMLDHQTIKSPRCPRTSINISQILIYIHTQASITEDLAKWLWKGGMPAPLQAKLLAFYYH